MTEHPLKHTWEVTFSQRDAEKKEKTVNVTGPSAISNKNWDAGAVKIVEFSTVETLYQALSHILRPSQLTNGDCISDINVFKKGIKPVWEDSLNMNGGRWLIRLKKEVTNRLWEEVLLALAADRIGATIYREHASDINVSDKINGIILSVRKDEDILSLWVAQSNRTERDALRDSLKTILAPILGAEASANLVLEYKPHPTNTYYRSPRTGAKSNGSTTGSAGFPNYHHHFHNQHHNHSRTNNSDNNSTLPIGTNFHNTEKYTPPFSRRLR